MAIPVPPTRSPALNTTTRGARSLCAEGDMAGARERVKLAGALWPPIKLEMLDDPELDGIR